MSSFCGCLDPRPPQWASEDEAALRKEFTIHGSCCCDGATDCFGCPWCEPIQFDLWWERRLLERVPAPTRFEREPVI